MWLLQDSYVSAVQETSTEALCEFMYNGHGPLRTTL